MKICHDHSASTTRLGVGMVPRRVSHTLDIELAFVSSQIGVGGSYANCYGIYDIAYVI